MQTICSVARAGKRPILFRPRGKGADQLPTGELPVVLDARHCVAHVAKIAVNVIRDEDGKNVLPQTLLAWFGPEAGMPGRKERVAFVMRGNAVHVEPA